MSESVHEKLVDSGLDTSCSAVLGSNMSRGAPRIFSRGGGRTFFPCVVAKIFPMCSGQKGARNQLNVSYLPCAPEHEGALAAKT